MKETIYTIPISEVFEPKDGCPLCRLTRMLEERCVDYISGAAMMEPDIRMDTNAKGFCSRHYDKLVHLEKRLPVALMLQSRLGHLREEILTKKAPLLGKDKRQQLAHESIESCYVCAKIDWAMERMLNTIFRLYRTEESFRALFNEQTDLCWPHYVLLTDTVPIHLKKGELESFRADAAALTLRTLDTHKKNIDAFCNLFDYRSAGSPVGDEVRSAIESAVEFLTSVPVDDKA